MSIKCPQCGAEFDVTLFTFDRGIRCDCGAWVDLASGHRTSVSTCVPDEAAVLAVCRNTYGRIMASLPGNVSAAQLAIAEELRQAGFGLGRRQRGTDRETADDSCRPG
jgi:hypothetical protein